jgi:hypothetical protein
MAATTGHSINTGPYREAIALIEPKLCINHWKVLYKLCVFYVDRNSHRWFRHYTLPDNTIGEQFPQEKTLIEY